MAITTSGVPIGSIGDQYSIAIGCSSDGLTATMVGYVLKEGTKWTESTNIQDTERLVQIDSPNATDRFTYFPKVSQGDWSGGERQVYFVDPTRYYQSDGNIDVTKPGALQLYGQMVPINLPAGFTTSDMGQSTPPHIGNSNPSTTDILGHGASANVARVNAGAMTGAVESASSANVVTSMAVARSGIAYYSVSDGIYNGATKLTGSVAASRGPVYWSGKLWYFDTSNPTVLRSNDGNGTDTVVSTSPFLEGGGGAPDDLIAGVDGIYYWFYTGMVTEVYSFDGATATLRATVNGQIVAACYAKGNIYFLANLIQVSSSPPQQQTHSFTYTGGNQSLTIPAGVTSMTVDMAGASGASGGNSTGTGGPGGSGARLQETVTVTPGDTLTIKVAGAGSGTTGGFGGGTGGAGGAASGGGTFGGGGGGASTIQNGALAFLGTAGGGGGGGGGNHPTGTNNVFAGAGGAGGGGGATGVNGSPGTTGSGSSFGVGATTGAVGAGGVSSGVGANNGSAGAAMTGGAGGAGSSVGNGPNNQGDTGPGGGGGGGVFGGGGGGDGVFLNSGTNFFCGSGNGGGGGSTAAGAGATGVSITSAYQSGNGYVTLTYTIPAGSGPTSTMFTLYAFSGSTLTVLDDLRMALKDFLPSSNTNLIGANLDSDETILYVAWPGSQFSIKGYLDNGSVFAAAPTPTQVNTAPGGMAVKANQTGLVVMSVSNGATTIWQRSPSALAPSGTLVTSDFDFGAPTSVKVFQAIEFEILQPLTGGSISCSFRLDDTQAWTSMSSITKSNGNIVFFLPRGSKGSRIQFQITLNSSGGNGPVIHSYSVTARLGRVWKGTLQCHRDVTLLNSQPDQQGMDSTALIANIQNCYNLAGGNVILYVPSPSLGGVEQVNAVLEEYDWGSVRTGPYTTDQTATTFEGEIDVTLVEAL